MLICIINDNLQYGGSEMNYHSFKNQLNNCCTEFELAKLMYDIIEDSINDENFNVKLLPKMTKELVEKNLNPTVIVDEEVCFFTIMYGSTEYHLEAAKIIFQKVATITTIEENEGLKNFYEFLCQKLEFDCWNVDNVVKTFLLANAYFGQDEYLVLSKNLYTEMFDDDFLYTSNNRELTNLELTTEIFKDIHRFDYCVEMLKQEKFLCGCWSLHIFDKASKIEVAVYH